MKFNIILPILISLLIIILGYHVYKTYTLETKISSLNQQMYSFLDCDLTTEKELKELSEKEFSYIRQQDRDTSFILMYIPCVFLLITILSYGNIHDVISRFKKYIEVKTKYYDEEHKKLHIDLVNIKNDLNREIGFLRESEANNYLNIDKFTDYVSMYLTAISYFSRCYSFHKKEKDTTEEQFALFHILKAINKVVADYDYNKIYSQEGSPLQLTDLQEQLIKDELLKYNSKQIEYEKVDNFFAEIIGLRDVQNEKCKYGSSKITANLISHDYYCLTILENHYVCIRKGYNKIVHISKSNAFEVILTSLGDIKVLLP